MYRTYRAKVKPSLKLLPEIRISEENVSLFQVLAWSLFVVLVFYGPSILFRSLRARSVNPSTHTWASLLGSLPVLSVHSYVSN